MTILEAVINLIHRAQGSHTDVVALGLSPCNFAAVVGVIQRQPSPGMGTAAVNGVEIVLDRYLADHLGMIQTTSGIFAYDIWPPGEYLDDANWGPQCDCGAAKCGSPGHAYWCTLSAAPIKLSDQDPDWVY